MKSTNNCIPNVSIIIVNYNGKQFLNDCLNSVLQTDYPNYEVILIDNGSSDGSAEYITHMFKDYPRITIALLDKNYGFSEGNNHGSSFINKKSKYIVFLNNDTKVEKSWLKELVNVMELDKNIGVAQAKLLIMNKNRVIDCAGALISRIGQVISCGYGQKDLGQYDCIREIFYAKGAAMIVRRNLWQFLKGFEPSFFFYWEDADFCWRVRLMGYKIVFIPNSIVYHASKATISKYYFSSVSFYDSRNRIFTLVSNYELKNLCKYLPITLIWYLIENLVKTVILMSIHPVLNEIKSTSWCFTNLKSIIKRRKYIQKYIRKITDKKAFKSIIMPNFFLYDREQFCLTPARQRARTLKTCPSSDEDRT